MSRLRRLASCAGLVSLFWISGCGLNPQPEPPSADETSEVPGARDGGGAQRAPEPDAEPGLGPTPDWPPADERDAGDDLKGDLDRDHSNDNEYSTDPGLPPPSAGPESDAGTGERDAATDTPPDAGGVLTL